MAKKAAPRAKKKAPKASEAAGCAAVKRSLAGTKSKKTTSKKKPAPKKPTPKKTASGKSTSKTARKTYPAGKSKQVPYDLVYVADSDLHGKGLFAHKAIAADVSLGKLEGKPTTRDGTHVLWLSSSKGLRITNEFRFINHSSKPNCALTGTKVVTLKKIKAHEELTHDYGW